MVVVDNPDNAVQLNAAAAAALPEGQRLQVLVDVDGGLMRTGIPFDKALDLGKLIHAQPSLQLRGIPPCCVTVVVVVVTDRSRR